MKLITARLGDDVYRTSKSPRACEGSCWLIKVGLVSLPHGPRELPLWSGFGCGLHQSYFG